MEFSDKFTVSDDVVAREVGGEMVLLDLESGLYFGLDTVGGRIWELLCERPHTLKELCDCIETEFDAPRSEIEIDLLALAKDMSDQDLIVSGAAA
jgi:hypothetical protein